MYIFIYICTTESVCYIPETKTTLQIKSMSIKTLKKKLNKIISMYTYSFLKNCFKTFREGLHCPSQCGSGSFLGQRPHPTS